MKPTVKCYLNYFLLYFKTLREYRVNWFLSFIKVPILFLLFWFIWKTLYRHLGSSMGGYSFYGMMLYLFAAQWIYFALSFNVAEKIAEDIRTGKLSIYLSRPIDYLPAQFCTFLGHLLFTLGVTLIPFCVVYGALLEEKMNWVRLIAFIFVAFHAGVLHFLLESCLGSAGFWLQRIFGLHYLLNTFFAIAGGRLLPLELFPKWFGAISYVSPLRAIYYEPIRVLLGQPVLPVLLLQAAWLGGLSGILFLLWRRGRLVYEAVG